MSDPDGQLGPSPSEQAERFSAMYEAGPPPWDIGRPQPAFLELAEQGALTGRVLDVGCGTGEHALMAAARGFDATGIDAISYADRHCAPQGSQPRSDGAVLGFGCAEIARPRRALRHRAGQRPVSRLRR